jgi:eukaryotic-like serine/threonine-protein kinase
MSTRIGPYLVQKELGRGGMGIVHLCLDERLGRNVAIKAIPAEYASDPVRLGRLEREARALASLSHPAIATVFGLEDHGGSRYIIMEFVPGQTLEQRLKSGPLPLEDALDIAAQIAHALDSAHEAGVIHRDLKPGNVMLTDQGRVKVLDFGLAKASGLAGAQPSGSNLTAASAPADTHTPTMPMSPVATIEGQVMGTPAYLSPEQARGRAVDKRTDIWAFGCVLFECLSGKMLFKGETASDSLAAVLERQIDLSSLPPRTPPRVRELLRRCLERDPKKRLRDIGDAAIELEEILSRIRTTGSAAELPAPAEPRRRSPALLVAASLAGLGIGVAMGVASMQLLKTRSAAPTPSRVAFTIPVEGGRANEAYDGNIGQRFDLSPDGKTIVYFGGTGGTNSLMLRPLDQPVATPVKGSGDASFPAWSPDSRQIVAVTPKGLTRFFLDGTVTTELSQVSMNSRGLVWNADDRIYAGQAGFMANSRIYAFDARSGAMSTIVGPEQNSISYRWPAPLSDGSAVLFVPFVGQTYQDVSISAIDARTGKVHVVLERAFGPRLIDDRILLFGRGTVVHAVRFDPKTLTTIGEAIPVLDDAWAEPDVLGALDVRVAKNGTLAYARKGNVVASQEFVRIDIDGKVTPLGISLPDGDGIALPDGNSIFMTSNVPLRQVVRVDLERKTYTKVTSVGRNWLQGISPDSQTLYFATTITGQRTVRAMPLRGSSPESANILDPAFNEVDGFRFSSDDRYVVGSVGIGGDSDTAIKWARFERKDGAFLPQSKAVFDGGYPHLSPDGRWVTYIVEEQDRPQVFIRSFPDMGAPIKLSAGTAKLAQWAPDGSRIWLADTQSGALSEISVSPPAISKPGADPAAAAQPAPTPITTPKFGVPKEFFRADENSPVDFGSGFIAASDSKSVYAFLKSKETVGSPEIVVITSWLAELERKLDAANAPSTSGSTAATESASP